MSYLLHYITSMKPSPYKQKRIEALKAKAKELYKLGYSTREVSKVLNRSHNWVAMAVREGVINT